MDPYLEAPDLWPDVHAELLVQFRGALQAQVSPRYVARVEQYTFLADPEGETPDVRIVPDVRLLSRGGPREEDGGVAVAEPPRATAMAGAMEVTAILGRMARQRHLALRDARNRELITVVELLSPANKRHGGSGRNAFLDKREEVTASSASWLEIDLLRGGESTVRVPQRAATAYAAFLDRTPDPGDDWRRQFLFPLPLREPLRPLPVPLRAGEPAAELDVQAALGAAYDRARYDVDADYANPPPAPPLGEEDAAWVTGLLREKGLRA